MLSKPSQYSVPLTNKDKQIINSFNLGISESIIKDILKDESNRIKSFEKCKICKAVLSEKLIRNEGEQRLECKFCKTQLEYSKSQINNMNLMNDDKAYFLDFNKIELKAQSSTNVLIVICLDYSGSMGMTYLAPDNSLGKSYLKKKPIDEQMKQYIKENTYISRKELLLVNLEEQLKSLFDSDTKYKYQVFVITFESDVIMYGNGSKQNFKLEMNKNDFNDLDACRNFGKNNATKVFEKNKDSNLPYLFQTLHSKEENGLTSLGPAVACGLGVVEALKPELCQFYVFTDGVANNGIGAMSEIKKDEKNKDKDKEIDKKNTQAKQVYEELASIGLEFGVVFHVIGYQDEESNLKLLLPLTASKGSELEKIKTPQLGAKKDLTYDEDDLKKIFKKALSVSADTYGILPKLRLFSSIETEVTFCKNSNKAVKVKKKGAAIILKKRMENISSDNLQLPCKYNVDNLKNSTKNLYFQFQLVFTKPTNGEKVFIVINISSEIRDLRNYNDVDLNVCNLIMMNDEFQENENLCGNYIEMMYLCKYWGEYNKKPHKTFDDAEETLKKYITKCFGSENQNLFSKYEKNAKQVVEKASNEEETIKRRKLNKDVVIQKIENEDDERTINKKKMKAFVEEEMSIKVKKKKNDNLAYELPKSSKNDKEAYDFEKRKEEQKYEEEENTLKKPKYAKKQENEEEENTLKKNKYAKKNEDEEEDENTKKRAIWLKK